ncbi:MFS transporter [Verrucomicrobium sp. BvORR106]|uniref:MFS transporter n=1 Tax=Verrucomicrobium sp. BvORR106 TaxID=1403819 RepID=UPI00056F00E9|nr:MFS transporter [Verrucomicrobium sp. BvORR106]
MNASSPNRRNARLLAVCQALYICAISIDLTLTGLTGYELAPDKSLATLPFAMITVSGAVVSYFAAFLLQRLGRRLGFTLGALIGAAGGGVSVWAVMEGRFWLFCAGTAGVGVYQAFALYYRLAAADAVEPEAKSRAISTVLAGGVLAAILGPALAAWSKDLIPSALFAGAYLMVALLGLVAAGLLWAFYRDGDSIESGGAQAVNGGPPRSLAVIVRQPVFVASMANNVIGSVTMLFVMTAAPLAAVSCHHSIDDGASIIQWHLVGMYAPSLITGWLIRRFGLLTLLLTGGVLNVACVVAAVSSTSLPAFYAALFALGVGWNFMFVGGSTLQAQSYRPSERAKTQGVSEFLRYATTAGATLAAGPVLQHYGWSTVNFAILPLLFVATAMTLWWGRQERAAKKEPLPA